MVDNETYKRVMQMENGDWREVHLYYQLMKDEKETIEEVLALISSRKNKHVDRLDCAFRVCLSLYFEAIKGKGGLYVDKLNKHILRLLDGFKLVIES